MSEDISRRRKLNTLRSAAAFKPRFTVAILAVSFVAAILEGIGLSFIVPVISVASGEVSGEASGLVGAFADLYAFLSVPFTLEYIVVGVGIVMIVRYTMSFLVSWFRASLQTQYVRHLQSIAYDRALDAEVGHFDDQGSDDMLNAIVTQANQGAQVIQIGVKIIEQAMISAVYLAIAVYLAPMLTLATGVLLGSLVALSRLGFASGYSVGDRVADANERVQGAAQAGTQGIRDVKLFGLAGELRGNFREAIDQYASSTIRIRRNQAAMDNFYQLIVALSVFGLIYGALEFTSLELGELGVFLFAVFRLGPRISSINNMLYRGEGQLPHLVRTHDFIETLEDRAEPTGGTSVEAPVSRVSFEDVTFSYPSEAAVLRDVSFSFSRDEFVAFVGPSGAGKSTIVSLLARFYEPDSGQIRADGTPIVEFDLEEWRSRISVVRQHPFIFNDTLRYNVTVGNRDATQAEIEEACEIAQVTEFFDELSDGYETQLGDDGVRLSGGQRQRVAIARALLKDADVLVLDEATSDLDTALERQVHEGVESMDRDVAMLVIAHRLSTVTGADRIYAMEDGHIEERGSHADLLEADGTYSDLYGAQHRG